MDDFNFPPPNFNTLENKKYQKIIEPKTQTNRGIVFHRKSWLDICEKGWNKVKLPSQGSQEGVY